MTVQLSKNLVFHAPLSEQYYNPATKRVTDLSPYSNHGTSANAAVFVADRMGQIRAMSFNGVSDYVDCGNNDSLNFGTEKFSIFLWANQGGTYDTYEGLVSDYTLNAGWIFAVRNNRIAFFDSPAGNWYYLSDVLMTDTYYHLGCIKNGTSLKLYIDNIEINEIVVSADFNSDSSVSTMIGKYGDIRNFNGSIADVRIYNRALSQEEITYLAESYNPKLAIGSLYKGLVLDQELNTTWYNPGAALVKDRSPYSNHGAVTGATVGAKWTSFNGTTDYVRIPDSVSLSPVNAMSAFAWVKGAAQSGKVILSHFDTGINQRSIHFGSNPSGSFNTMRILISDDGTFDVGHRKNYFSSIVAFDNTPHQIGFTFDAGALKLYVDGIEDTNPTKTSDDAITTIHNSTADVMIGCYLNSDVQTGLFTGDIAKPRIWNQAITPTEALLWFDQTRGLFL